MSERAARVIQLLLWLPVAVGLAVLRRAARAVAGARRRSGALVALALAIALVADFDAGAAGLQHTVDESWIPDLGVRYQLGRRRDQRLPGPADGGALARRDALLGAAAMPERPRALLLHARRSPRRPTLGAFLAQDLLLFVLFFDLMLIPFFFLIGTFGGENRDRGDDEDDRLHAGRLAADAGRRDRHRDPRLGPDRRSSTSRSRTCARHLLSSGSQYWIFCFFAAAFLVKMPAVPAPRLDARRLPGGAAAGAGAALRRALEGRRLRLPARRAAALPARDRPLPGADPADRASPRSSTAR